MGSIPNDFPISLRSWPSKQNDLKTGLPTLIQRINLERGGFREISEESLKQEIANVVAAGTSSNGASDDEEEAEEENEPDRLKEVMTVREEMLGHVDQAHQSAMYALDFISLLLSKDQPVQASSTISPDLRNMISMGTLGADKLHTPRIRDAEKQDNKRVAKGWKIQNLNKAVDSILASAGRLEKEIERETKYWEQILAVSDAGWSLCRMPNERHILGVRFGFSEASPVFKNSSLAALRRSPDGTISLDQSTARAEARALRVRIYNSNTETGCSTLPSSYADDAPIEMTILQARNSIFAAELWQELNREARSIGGLGVHISGDTVVCPLTASKNVVLDLVSVADTSTAPQRPDDNIAQAIYFALHLFLSHAHRQNHRRRTQPPPPISNQTRLLPPYNLLRPLVSRLNHQSAISSIHTLLKPLCIVLKSMKLASSSSYNTVSTLPPVELTNKLSFAETTIMFLTDRLENVTTFKITSAVSIIVHSRTALSSVTTSHTISLQPTDSPLTSICPPPQHPVEGWSGVQEYILYATSCALITSLVDTVGSNTSTSSMAYGWEPTIQANVIQKTDAENIENSTKQLSLTLLKDKGVVVARVRWGSRSMDFGESLNGSGKEVRMYEWKAKESEANTNGDWENGEGELVRSLTDVVREAGKI